jgi:hypothetical protein
MISPANSAPSAIEIPNSAEARYATPSDAVEHPRHHPLAGDQHDPREHGDLAKCQNDRQSRVLELQNSHSLPVDDLAADLRPCWDQDQDHNHGEIFNDQPTDRQSPPLRLHQPPFLQRPQRDHRTRYRYCQSEHDAGLE